MRARWVIDRLIAPLLAASLCWSSDKVGAAANDGLWVLEHFSDNVTVLRTSHPNPSSSSWVSLILSCVDADQRLRLTWSREMSEPSAIAEGGTVLVSGSGPSSAGSAPTGSVIARFKKSNTATLTIAGQDRRGSAGAIVAIARILMRRPGGLVFLFHGGNGVVTLPGLLAYHLPLPASPGDTAAFGDFIDACASRPSPETGDERSRVGRQRP